MSRSRDICIYDIPITLKLDWHLGSTTADVVKFQSDAIIQITNLAASNFTSSYD